MGFFLGAPDADRPGHAAFDCTAVAPRLSVVLGQKLAAQSVPVLGAIAGGGTNYVYTRYYQQIAPVCISGYVRLAVDADISHDELVRKLSFAECKDSAASMPSTLERNARYMLCHDLQPPAK